MLTEQNKKFVMEYIKRHCRGQGEAAIAAGYSPKTAAQQACMLLKKPEIIEYLNAQKALIMSDVRQQFLFEAKEALEVMHHIMMDPEADEKARLIAARDFLDRAGFKPVDKTEVSGGLSVTLEVDDDVNAQD